MSVRERTLLTAFLWICIAVWASVIAGNFRETRINHLKTKADLETQDTLFDNRSSIENRLQNALDRLDPSKTYARQQLVGRLDAFARTSNLTVDISNPNTEESDTVNVHTVRIQVRKAGLAELIDFDNQVKSESPYLSLERVRLIPNKSDPRFLNAQFVVSSFELKSQTI
jgi:hypothetical protein